MSVKGVVFRLNQPNVVGEEFEGEVVAVNLESGVYFSLVGSGADIWKRLTLGAADVDTLVATLTRTYDCSGVEVRGDVAQFLAELADRDLIVAQDAPPAAAVSDTVDLTDPRPYEAPRVEAFNDLQDILLLDPIHDVDEAGWPVAAPPAPGSQQ